jgi:hypothetical protein
MAFCSLRPVHLPSSYVYLSATPQLHSQRLSRLQVGTHARPQRQRCLTPHRQEPSRSDPCPTQRPHSPTNSRQAMSRTTHCDSVGEKANTTSKERRQWRRKSTEESVNGELDSIRRSWRGSRLMTRQDVKSNMFDAVVRLGKRTAA